MKRNIKLSKSSITSEEILAVNKVLSKEYLGMGEEVRKFELELSSFFQRKVLCVSTGTAAIQLALQAVGIGRGDEVLVQSLTYVATFQAISALGAIPIACDIEGDSLTIDLVDAGNRITSRTKAIVPVHYAGNPGNLASIYNFARQHDLRVIEDASHAFGSNYKGKLIGSFGDVCAISLDGIKNLTSGEGGIVISDDTEVLQAVSDARLLGVMKDSEKRYEGLRSWDFDVCNQGWRYHMSNIMAAIGLVQLNRFEDLKGKRQMLAMNYVNILKGKVDIINCDYSEIVPHIFVVFVDDNSRDRIREELNELGISTGLHYKPNHLLTYFKNIKGSDRFPVTDRAYRRLITLPLHPDMSKEDVEYVCKNLLELVGANN